MYRVIFSMLHTHHTAMYVQGDFFNVTHPPHSLLSSKYQKSPFILEVYLDPGLCDGVKHDAEPAAQERVAADHEDELCGQDNLSS